MCAGLAVGAHSLWSYHMPSQHESPAIECDALTKRYPGGYVAPHEMRNDSSCGAALGLLMLGMMGGYAAVLT